MGPYSCSGSKEEERLTRGEENQETHPTEVTSTAACIQVKEKGTYQSGVPQGWGMGKLKDQRMLSCRVKGKQKQWKLILSRE